MYQTTLWMLYQEHTLYSLMRSNRLNQRPLERIAEMIQPEYFNFLFQVWSGVMLCSEWREYELCARGRTERFSCIKSNKIYGT